MKGMHVDHWMKDDFGTVNNNAICRALVMLYEMN